MSKLNLPNVTLIAISSVKIQQTLNALKYSMRGINFGEVVFVTHDYALDNVKGDLEGITINHVSRINDIDRFSRMCVYDLPKWVNTEFMILSAWDSAIVHPGQWTDEFLEYDYVGPLWTKGHNYFDKNGNQVRVGNGHALRSQKLINLASKLELPWEPFTNNGQHEAGYWEDAWICVKNRHIYEEHGCKFAPIEVAAKWGRELHRPPIEENEGITPFLFHGRQDPYLDKIAHEESVKEIFS